MQQIKSSKFNWVDIQEPNADDILKVQKKYNLHPLVIEEFSTPTLRPKAAEYDNSLFLTIHVPLFDNNLKTTFPGELDIVITQDTLITAHDVEIWQLSEFFENIQKNKAQRDRYMSESPAKLLYFIIEMLLESCFPKLDHISRKLDYIEAEIFAGNEKGMVLEISVVKRDILNFRRTLKPQRSVIESLIQSNYALIDKDLKLYFQELIGTNIRAWNSLESTKETIESLEDTNNSLLSNKLNMTMKVLTIFSAVMLPMTVYSNILAMSADIPFGKSPHAFVIHTSVMLFVAVITFIVFKIKRWI
ncbi:MAG: Mg2 transporter protein CorA family protein [Candidatus Moranbacteria bacterium GW2011_GWA2_39_41]|nr:MAG: Mg2 transporter protein CorA family protein [Candidatus Moranbacteria bacterium GW2011_GWA2_39_41]